VVRRGAAKLSLCQSYRQLLLDYEASDVWLSLPRSSGDELWKSWASRVHNRAVEIDLQKRKSAILGRVSLRLYSEIKPLDARAVYLFTQSWP
jgi:hypothetical protein